MDRRGVPTSGERRSWTWRRGRVLGAALVLLILIVVTSVGSFTDLLRVCDVPAGPDTMCRPLSLADPPVILGILLALGFLLPDVQTLRIGADGVEIEKDTVGEDEDLTGRVDLLERKIELYREPTPPSGEGEDR